MKSALSRMAATLLLIGAFGTASLADHSEKICTKNTGCSARIVMAGQQYEFTFREGDILSTKAGWIVNSNDGWAHRK